MKICVTNTTTGTTSIGSKIKLIPGRNEIDSDLWEAVASIRGIREKIRVGDFVVEAMTPIEIETKPEEKPEEKPSESSKKSKGSRKKKSEEKSETIGELDDTLNDEENGESD